MEISATACLGFPPSNPDVVTLSLDADPKLPVVLRSQGTFNQANCQLVKSANLSSKSIVPYTNLVLPQPAGLVRLLQVIRHHV